MNERIQKLWDLSRYSSGRGHDEEKFAELIVKECAGYMYKHFPHSRYEINLMRRHMGDKDWNKPIGGVKE